MRQYHDLMRHVLENGATKDDRTGTGTRSVFGHQMRFDLNEGFPLMTTKKTAFRLIVSELLWFIKGDTNVKTLLEENNHIWDEWAFAQWVESDEYEGPVALYNLARRLRAADVSGRVIIVPAMNYPAFRAGTRTSPVDKGNMNRSFPGRPDGTVTEKIADYFQRHLVDPRVATGALDLPVHIEATEVEALVRDREQLWAEAARMFLATQVIDEARHVEVFTHRLKLLGKSDIDATLRQYVNPRMFAFHDAMRERVLEARDFVGGVIGQNLALEGLALGFFEFNASLLKDVDPGTSRVLETVLLDERRHVGFGLVRLRELCDEDAAGRAHRQRLGDALADRQAARHLQPVGDPAVPARQRIGMRQDLGLRHGCSRVREAPRGAGNYVREARRATGRGAVSA